MSVTDGKEWLKLSISIWDDSKTKEDKRLNHPASFPLSIASKLIKIYSEPKDVVLDPFMGTGSTLVAATQLQRKSIGFEINEEYIDLFYKRLSSIPSDLFSVINSSCLNINNFIPDNHIDLCITSPPYWDILNRRRSADQKEIVNYGNLQNDLGNIKDYKDFILNLKISFTKIYHCLKPKKHCVIIVQDIRKKSTFYPFHIDVTRMMQEIGFTLEDFIIWDRRKDYNNFRPLGFPYVFRVNKAHEYICIFKKT